MEILRLLVNMLEVCDYFDKTWSREFQKEFAPGSSVTIKFPQKFTTSDGMGYQPQGIQRVSTSVSLDNWIQIGFEWDDYERAVKLERSESELRENYWQPAAAAMAQEWDSRAAKYAYQNSSMVVGALGTDPTSVSTFYAGRRALKEQACPPGKRCALISSSMMATLGSNITNIFNPPDEISKMFKEGAIGRLGGFDFYESNSLWSHTAGSFAATCTVTGANQSGTQLIVTGTNGDVLNAGDKIAIANVNRVNPMTRRIVGPATLKQFTITQTITLTGGNDTINILPAIYGPTGTFAQYQNVDALPANGAAITLWPGTTSPNGKVGTAGLMLTKFAFALVGAKLYTPKAVESAGQAQDPDSGLAVRKVVAWDPVRSMQVNRLDSLGGFGTLYQDNAAVVLAGA